MIVGAGVGGVATYVLLGNEEQSSEPIKIGFLGDLDGVVGIPMWQGAILAVEEINAEGGILGRQVELIGEDDDNGQDVVVQSNALAKLMNHDNVDFVVGVTSGQTEFMVQDIIAQHKIIFISSGSGFDELTQRVLDDYDKYKYYFSVVFNSTSQYFCAGGLVPV